MVNDDGGTAVASDWTLSATGPTPISGPSLVSGAVSAGVYTLAEDGPDGYTSSGWMCEGGSVDPDTGAVTIGLGESVHCVVTNDDVAPTITVFKDVINDAGGTAVAGDFTLTLAPADGAAYEVEQGVATTVAAGVAYTVGEVPIAGYEIDEITCATFDDEEGRLLGNPVTLGLDEHVVCTVINDDIAPTLAVQVQVHSGSAAPDDFDPVIIGDFEEEAMASLATGFGPIVPFDHVELIVHVNCGEPIEVIAGHYYATAITLMEGYVETGGHVCTDVATGEPVAYPVYPELGQQIFCVYQVELLPSVTVLKNADPAEGEFSFTLTPDGSDVEPSTETVSGNAGTHTWQFVEPGSYTLVEDTSVDWSLESVVCEGVEAEDILNGVSFDLDYGDEVTCTFENLSEQVDLSVVKTDVADPVFVNSTDRTGVIVYRLTVTNAGPGDATGVTLVDTLDPTTPFTSAVPSQGSCSHSGGVITCALGDLAAEASATITILASTLDVEEIVDILVDNVAVVSGDQTETDTTNNRDVEDTTLVPVLQEEILPDTGADVGPWAMAGIFLVLAGAGLVRFRGPRRGNHRV